MYLLGVGLAAATTGCSGSCSEAQELCQKCEVENLGNCTRFDDLSADECEEAVDTYIANCPAATA